MCIIVYKPKGKLIPYQSFKNCFENNDDGAGYMFAFEGKVHIHKGYMNLKDLKFSLRKTFKMIPEKEISLVIHFRLATHGIKSPGNCHPFPMSNDHEELIKTSNICNIGAAHNGVISGLPRHKQLSDTMLFIQNVMERFNFEQLKRPEYKSLIELATNSKWVIMNNNGEVLLYGGDWVKDTTGIVYSNTGYLTVIKWNWMNDSGLDSLDWTEEKYWKKDRIDYRKEIDEQSYKNNVVDLQECEYCGCSAPLTEIELEAGEVIEVCDICFDMITAQNVFEN